MITAEVRLQDGVLAAFRLDGHAEVGPRGADPVCAAVTVLVRSTARLLASSERVQVAGSAANAGSMDVRVLTVESHSRLWLRGVGEALLTGLRDLATEYPQALKLVEHSG